MFVRHSLKFLLVVIASLTFSPTVSATSVPSNEMLHVMFLELKGKLITVAKENEALRTEVGNLRKEVGSLRTKSTAPVALQMASLSDKPMGGSLAEAETPASEPSPVTIFAIKPQKREMTPYDLDLTKGWWREGNYVAIGGGLVEVEDADLTALNIPGTFGELRSKRGFLANGALGHRFENGIRSELEFAYRRTFLDRITAYRSGALSTSNRNGTLTDYAIMANGYYDIKTQSKITPYLGVGIGVSRTYVYFDDDDNTDKTDFNFAYQLAAGLTYPLFPKVTIGGGYKFYATKKPTYDDEVEAEYQSHNAELRLLYGF